MRFEIGPGGMLVILLGLAGLSGAVFGLGLVAGHELSGPEPGSQSVVAAYPLPPAAPGSAPALPAEASAPPVNPGSAAASASASTGLGSTGAGSNEAAVNPPSSAAGEAATLKAPVPAASTLRKSATSKNALALRRSRTAATASDEDLSTGAAVAPPPEPGSASAEPAGADEEEPESAPAAPPAPAHRRLAAVNPPAPRAASGPYSVQIDAVMDLQGAQEMARKIKARGFQPFVVQTEVDGKTWYRLRVGHYATPEEAQAAESRLHQEFNQNPPGN